MKTKNYTKHFLLRAAMTLLVLLFANTSSWAQYVFVIANPGNGGEVRVGKTTDLGAYQEGGSFADGVEPGETVYFDFRPFEGYKFTGITYDENLSSDAVTLLDNGLYSFTMPDVSGWINININFAKDIVVPTGVSINEENFPDEHFRNWLLSQSYGSDAVIDSREMSGLTKISALACGIEDLTGIQLFPELTELDVSNLEGKHPKEEWNKISAIDLSGNPKLRKLCIDNNLLTSIDLSPCPDLHNLQVVGNQLKELDVSSNKKLSMLSCMDNQLASLDVSQNTDLGVLSCYGNELTSLDVANNLSLEQLYCENNQLTSIDVTNHDKLTIFNCNNNQLTTLSLTGCTELYQLYCYNNMISGQAMTDLVNSLETPPRGGYMVVLDLDSEIEQNDITEEQSATAKGKKWSVEAMENERYIPYPPSNTHDYVDLGLTSGTLWATCNVGATIPQDIGDFFAWGDTEGHGTDISDGYLFSWENYKWGEVNGEETSFTKYCCDSSRGKDGFTDGKYELDPEDDAAYVNWGSQWRTPTKEQFDELRDECTWTPMTIGDIKGYEIEGKNGNTIFLPEAGWRLDDMLLEGGAYWTRSSNPEDVAGAYYFGWDDWGWYSYGARTDGQSVRPVLCKQDDAKIGDVNGDGEITVADVMLLVNYILGYDNDIFIIENANIDGEEGITVTDVMLLVKMVLNDN